MSEVDALLEQYTRHVHVAWPTDVAPEQRVWFVIYDPVQERRLRLRLGDFESATLAAGLAWRLIDLTDAFAMWMAAHEYRESYFEDAPAMELALDDFLDGLNQRIAKHEGREKQVGHSYLLDDGQPVSEVDEFACRFREEILPLLQEYCYDEYAALARFIGSELVDAEAGTLNMEKIDDAEQLVAALAREFGEGGASTQ